jgi:hypothetical protein
LSIRHNQTSLSVDRQQAIRRIRIREIWTREVGNPGAALVATSHPETKKMTFSINTKVAPIGRR